MANAIIDYIVILFAVVYYAFLCFVYVIRAFGNDKLELALAPAFSVQLGPFAALWFANLFTGADIFRLITLLPIIIFLIYDIWYRLLTKMKPTHHPKKWPAALVVYLALLMVGSIALNWYGFLVSTMLGRMLIACFFIMMGCFGFYQNKYSKRMQAGTDKAVPGGK
jgi:ABC-type uncharacterized transport system permease subunit